MGMYNFHYVPKEQRSTKCEVQDGVHAVKIVGANIKTSRNGRQMYEVMLAVDHNAHNIYLHRIVESQWFDIVMSDFLDAFGLQTEDVMNIAKWIGKTGQAEFYHKETKEYGKQVALKTFVLSASPQYEKSQPQQPQAPQQAQGQMQGQWQQAARASSLPQNAAQVQAQQQQGFVEQAAQASSLDVPF